MAEKDRYSPVDQPFKFNPYKEVKMIPTCSSYGGDWRNAPFKVRSEVKIILEDDISIGYENELSKPLENFKDVVKKFLGGAMKSAANAASSLVPPVIGNIASGVAVTLENLDLTKVGTAIAGLKGDVSSLNVLNKPFFENMRAWESADPFTFSLTCKFYFGQFGLNDAEEEVYKPIINLACLGAPFMSSNLYSIKGPYPTVAGLTGIMLNSIGTSVYGKITGKKPRSSSAGGAISEIDGTEYATDKNPLWESLAREGELSMFTGAFDDIITSISTDLQGKLGESKFVNVEVGKLKLQNLYIQDVSFEFSKETAAKTKIAEDGTERTVETSYPMSGSVTISFKSYKQVGQKQWHV